MISQITHDLKSPITVIQNNLENRSAFINDEGRLHFKALEVSTKLFEYYIYDLIVLLILMLGL